MLTPRQVSYQFKGSERFGLLVGFANVMDVLKGIIIDRETKQYNEVSLENIKDVQ